MSEHVSQNLHAYHDGELSAPAARDAEAHLASCEACRAELAAIESTSNRVRTASLAEPSAAALDRFESAPSAARDRELRRLVGWLSAAAAVAIAVALPRAIERRDASPTLLSPADTVAMLPDGDAEPATLLAARWMAADLSLDH